MRRPRLRAMVMLLALGMATAAAASPPPPPDTAAVASAPDAARLAAIRADVGPHVARVTCAAGAFELPEARMDSTGIWSASEAAYRPARQAIVVTGDASPSLPPKPIAWAIVDSIEVGRSLGAKGAKVGAVIGLLGAGFVIFVSGHVADETALSESGAKATLLVSCAAIGGLVGAAITAPSKHWRTVYWRGD